MIEPLIDNLKYFRPGDLAPPRRKELRPQYRPRIAQANKPPRGPYSRPPWRVIGRRRDRMACPAFLRNDLLGTRPSTKSAPKGEVSLNKRTLLRLETGRKHGYVHSREQVANFSEAALPFEQTISDALVQFRRCYLSRCVDQGSLMADVRSGGFHRDKQCRTAGALAPQAGRGDRGTACRNNQG